MAPLTERASAPGSRLLRWEVGVVLAIYPLSWTLGAVAGLGEAAAGRRPDRFAVQLPDHQVLSAAVDALVSLRMFLPVLLVGFLLARSGESLGAVGLARRFSPRDGWTTVALFATVVGFTAAAAPLTFGTFRWENAHGLPAYFLVPGYVDALATGFGEEIVVSGYLLHRLDQLGWAPRSALLASTGVRVAYHVYAGLGVLPVLGMGVVFALAWQRRRNLWPLIAAHTLFDGMLATLDAF
jgi:membrane protease YdiL (CAAX protease family)